LYDGLRHAHVLGEAHQHDSREVLEAAAFMHDVGRAKGNNNRQKKSFRMIVKLSRPLGWSPRELELAAIVARYHRGALPTPRRKIMQHLDLPDRHLALELAGVLRLANSLDSARNTEMKLTVEARDHVVIVHVAGYSPLDRSAEEIAASRHLLETVIHRPIMVRTLRTVRRHHARTS